MLPVAMSFLKSFPPPGPAEGLRQQQPDTEAVLDGKGLGTGTLYIAESRLSWLDGSGLGFSLEYPAISLHAVSRDLNAYPREHLYVMVNAKFGEGPKESVGDEEEDSDDDIEPIAEFRFVPSDKSALEAMFTAMCECQALHPDPEDEDSDDYEGEEYDVEAHEFVIFLKGTCILMRKNILQYKLKFPPWCNVGLPDLRNILLSFSSLDM
ncbi:methylosome subunit pICln isoform X2 [Loxodonta africana]|uniref:methylosome subunit pICln isoform X2 n=1 Tax=Loxodonta africana TaxID=9785 RepID=UPI0030D3DFA5